MDGKVTARSRACWERFQFGTVKKSLILSLNNARRHLTTGQKAMAVAIAYPDAAKFNGNRFSSGINLIPLENINKGRLSQRKPLFWHKLVPVATLNKTMAPFVPILSPSGKCKFAYSARRNSTSFYCGKVASIGATCNVSYKNR